VAVVGLEFQVRSGNAVSETKKLTTAAQQLENAVNNASTRLRDANGRFIATGRSAAGASNGIRQFSAATAQATRSVGMLEGALGGLSAQLATGLAFGQAIKSATEFESIISDIGKTSSASQKDLEAVAVALKELSAPAKTNLAPTVLAKGLQDLVAQGLNLPDAVTSLETLGKVATATNSELTDVTKTGFQLQSALKIKPNELKATFDALAFAGKAGAFELKDMAQFMPTIASAATSLGITGKQGAISLAAMMQMVRKDAPGAAEASTRLTDALLKMTAPDAAKNFKKFGVDIEQVLKNAVKNGVNPMDAAVKELARVTGGDPFKLSQIFGDKEAKLALMSLMKYRDEYEKLKASAGGAAAAGTVQGDFEKSLKTFQGQLNSLKAASEVAAISLGTALLPILAKLLETALPIIQAITNIAGAFNSLPDPIKNNVAELVKLIVQLLLVQKTISAVTGVATLLRGAMSLLAIQTGLTATAALRGNAAMYALTTGMSTATVKAAGLLGILSRLAAFGVIAIAVNIAVNGIQNLVSAMAEINKLRGRKAAGGAAAMFAGSTKEEVVRQQAIAKQVINNERKTLKELTSIGSRAIQSANIGGVLNAFGANLPTISSANERQMQANARIGSAQAVLGLDPTKFKQAQTTTTDTTNTLGPGVEPQGKEKKAKKAKKERESELAQIQAANGLFASQEVIKARIAKAEYDQNQLEVMRLQMVGRGIDLLAQAAAIQREKIPQDEKDAKMLGVKSGLIASENQYQREIAQHIKQQQEPLNAIILANKTKLEDDKAYQRLIAEGINPEIAKQYVEIDRAGKALQKSLEPAVALAKAALAEAEARGLSADQVARLKKELEDLQKLPEQKVAEAKATITPEKTRRERLDEAYNKIKNNLKELVDPVNQIIGAANAIGDAFANSFEGMITGAMTAQEALRSLFQSIASHFTKMATQMIADAVKMMAIKLITQLVGSILGGIAGGAKGGKTLESANMKDLNKYATEPPIGIPAPYATGGYVTGPTNAIIGEGGQPEYVIPASKMMQAMSNYSAGKRGASILGDSSAMGNGGMGDGGNAFTLETVVINNVEYATVDQVRAMGNAAAKQGAEGGFSRSMSSLRNSRSQRSRLGMR